MLFDQIKIELATINDATHISGLITGLSEYFLESSGNSQAFLASISPNSIQGYIKDPDFDYRTVKLDGNLIAVIALQNQNHLYHLFVSPEYHRHGIARYLWEDAKQRMLLAGVRGEFTVNSSDFGVALYESLGFIRDAETQSKNGVRYVPMRLPI